MKLENAITEADKLRPNTLDTAQKYEWLFELEGEFAEMMGIDPPENNQPYASGTSPESLMEYPHDGCYPLFLCAKIDNALEETDRFQNDSVVANTAIAEAKAWYRRNNVPSKHYGVKL